jgi:hypothetical protein
MTPLKNQSIVNSLLSHRWMTVMIFALIFMASCTPKLEFLTSSIVPAARGTVKVKMDGNKNHTIDIALTNLAEPDRLNPPKKLYMVWMETDQGITKNLGQINTDSGTFSKTLKSNFNTVTTFTPVKIFITAEDDANAQSPAWEVVLTTARF